MLSHPRLGLDLVAVTMPLAHIKCPRSIDFTAELPRLPTGKFYKRELRERYWAGHTSRIL